MDSNEPITGHSLKVTRVTQRVKAVQIATAMGVSKSRVSMIEREQFPSDDMISRYLAALATCASSATSSEDAA